MTGCFATRSNDTDARSISGGTSGAAGWWNCETVKNDAGEMRCSRRGGFTPNRPPSRYCWNRAATTSCSCRFHDVLENGISR